MNNYFKQHNIRPNRAFTLIETMIAVLILVMVMNGMLSIMSQNIFQARYARNNIVSNYLAQEAIDYIRNDRDTVAFQQKDAGGGWQNFLNKYGKLDGSKCFSTVGCDIDVVAGSVIDLSAYSANPAPFSIKGPILYYNDAGTTYFYSINTTGAVKSNIKRQIKMSTNSGNGDQELDIKVTVEYLNGSLVKSKVYRVSLLNWQQ